MWKQPQPNDALRRVSAAPGYRPDLVNITEHQPGPVCDFLADRRQHDIFRRPLDELHTQFFLEFFDLGAQGRLADKTGVGGLAEVVKISEFDEILQGAQVHAAIILVPG
jgi:hypothetical protein